MLQRCARSVEIGASAAFALSYLSMTAMGFVLLHRPFGVLVGVNYGAL